MPSINVSLQAGGPIVTVAIGVSVPKGVALKAAGIAVPPTVVGTFLIDTGASGTCVDPALVAKLGLAPTGAVSMQTPSTNGTPVQCNLYDASVYIPGAQGQGGFLIDALPIMECSLSAQGIDGLIGRDIINRCTLIYNGSAGFFTLAY